MGILRKCHCGMEFRTSTDILLRRCGQCRKKQVNIRTANPKPLKLNKLIKEMLQVHYG